MHNLQVDNDNSQIQYSFMSSRDVQCVRNSVSTIKSAENVIKSSAMWESVQKNIKKINNNNNKNRPK